MVGLLFFRVFSSFFLSFILIETASLTWMKLFLSEIILSGEKRGTFYIYKSFKELPSWPVGPIEYVQIMRKVEVESYMKTYNPRAGWLGTCIA